MATVFGTSGNDVINATYVDAFGNSVSDANDTVFADPGNDLVFGLGGNDVLDGGADNDVLIGGPGADALFGGTGNDTASYATSAAGVTVSLAAGVGANGDAEGDTLNGIENLTGSDFNDVLIGDASANRLIGGAGNDVIAAGVEDFILGGGGIDTVTFLFSAEAVSINLLSGGSIQGIESVIGSNFDDTIRGDDGDNFLDGGAGDDELLGEFGDDELEGGDGNDRLDGGGGNNTLSGGPGNDTYIVRALTDHVSEGIASSGVDAVLSSITYSLATDASGDVENLTLTGSGALNGTGNGLANEITGNASANKLLGLGGNDFLFGLSGNDKLFGDAGNDTLTGAKGRDVMFGDAGRDIFDFNAIADSKKGAQRDKINHFSRGQNDKIDLEDIDAKTGVSGNNKFKFIGKDDFHDKKGELRYEDKGSKVIVQGDVNGDGKADFEIFVKVGALSSGDFFL